MGNPGAWIKVDPIVVFHKNISSNPFSLPPEFTLPVNQTQGDDSVHSPGHRFLGPQAEEFNEQQVDGYNIHQVVRELGMLRARIDAAGLVVPFGGTSPPTYRSYEPDE